MKAKKYTEEQIIAVLKEGEADSLIDLARQAVDTTDVGKVPEGV